MKANKKSVYWGEISFVDIIIRSVILWAVLLILDINNIPSLYINKYGYVVSEIIVGSAFLLWILFIIKQNVLSAFKIPCGNEVDEIMIMVILTSCGYFFALTNYRNWTYKLFFTIALFTISCAITVGRIIFCWRKKAIAERSRQDVIDLYQLINDDIDHDRRPIMIAETDSKHDLLGREGLINLLYDSMLCKNQDNSYVIGVNGKWGSGKTTLINMAKAKLCENNPNIIVIDEFDPWFFSSQEALLSAIYDAILNKIGVRYNSIRSKMAVLKAIEAVTEDFKYKGILKNLLFMESDTINSVNDIKNRIAMLLRQTNKSIVFIIDNIDRADANNILFLFKLIGAIFNIPNIVYVLAYDKERLDEILKNTNNINPRYTEKIIQQEIFIPAMSKENFEKTIDISIEKALKHYGVDAKDMELYKTLEATMHKQISDLRQFKRLLNSAFANAFCYDNYLYKPHLLAIEVIRFLEPELYEEIRKNREYFISRDMYLDRMLTFFANSRKFNDKAKCFFDELFDKFPNYKDLLGEMFEYVDRYKQGAYIENDYSLMGAGNYNEKNANISSGKYFDLYFSYGENVFLRLDIRVKQFINEINSMNSDEDVKEFTCRTISEIKEQREWFERLQTQCDDINLDYRKDVAYGICKLHTSIDSSTCFMPALPANERALFVASILLEGAEDEGVVEEFIDSMPSVGKIYVLEQLVEEFKYLAKRGNKDFSRCALERYKKECDYIIQNDINLYDDEYYYKYSIWSLCQCYNNNPEVIHTYISKVISGRNVFRIIGDLISEVPNIDGFKYFIIKERFEILVGNRQVITDVLEHVEPQDDSERFALSIWDSFNVA